jgi:hypothetical protein
VLAVERALDVHEAGVVAGGADLGAGVEDGAVFSASMAVETSAFLMAKVPPKPQHCSRLGSSTSSMPRTCCEQRMRAVAEVEVAQAVAAGVVGDAVRVVGADVFEAELVGEELGELEDLGEEVGDFGLRPGSPICARHLGVVVAHHGDAGGRGDDDGFGMLELVDEAAQEGQASAW